jgi:5,10-methylenetetrahydromethanopterin reductase
VAGQRPLARLREAITVIRALLDEGEVTFDGEFFRYSDVVIGVRPVQERLPLLIGAMGGPMTFRLAGEISDGVHFAGVDRDNSTYVVEQVRQGALKAGRDPAALDHAAFCPIAVAEDGAAAREALRTLMAGWITSMPQNLLERLGIDPSQVDRIATALSNGDMVEALRLTPPEVATTIGVTGTPEECLQQIRTELVEPGIDHIIMGITDPEMVESITGIKMDGVPSVVDQMRLVHDRVIPAFRSGSGALS